MFSVKSWVSVGTKRPGFAAFWSLCLLSQHGSVQQMEFLVLFMGYRGRAAASLSVLMDGACQGVGRSRAHHCTPLLWGYLLSSDCFKELKDQLVALQAGKEAVIPC